jgi:hypothetical protein
MDQVSRLVVTDPEGDPIFHPWGTREEAVAKMESTRKVLGNAYEYSIETR